MARLWLLIESEEEVEWADCSESPHDADTFFSLVILVKFVWLSTVFLNGDSMARIWALCGELAKLFGDDELDEDAIDGAVICWRSELWNWWFDVLGSLSLKNKNKMLKTNE